LRKILNFSLTKTHVPLVLFGWLVGFVSCRNNKRIIVTFRGSKGFFHTSRDWQTNLNARVKGLRTPKKIKDKMKGVLQERVLVHKGFYDYLFDNNRMDGHQRYDKIVDDIESAMNGEEGYSVYITGHRYVK
jgi:hypothetical protein